MLRDDMKDLLWFLAVASERNFTKAAATSQSTLSHTIKQLEVRLGVRLLTRTTRSVVPTEAGERLFQSLAPHIEQIEADIAGLVAFRETPAGTVRITLSESHLRRRHSRPPRAQCASHRTHRREPPAHPQAAQNGLTQNHSR